MGKINILDKDTFFTIKYYFCPKKNKKRWNKTERVYTQVAKSFTKLHECYGTEKMLDD